MSASPVQGVDVLGVTKMGPAERLGEGILPTGRGHKVDVIRHQAIAEDPQAVFSGFFFQEGKINLAVPIDEKHILAVVPALCDMMGPVWDDDSCDPRHN